MIKKGVIEEIDCEQAAFILNSFTRPKSGGSLRIILDLTKLNEDIECRHFKMDGLKTATSLMSPGCWMASIDWKDAYYSVPIDKDQRKVLAFNWKDKTYQYTCLPNGLSCAPRFFTKLTKVMFAELRKKGFISTSYIGDCLVFGDSFKACEANVEETAKMSVNAGFVVHPEKSVVIPTQKIMFLGFLLDSKDMTVKPTAEKVEKLKVRVSSFCPKKKWR